MNDAYLLPGRAKGKVSNGMFHVICFFGRD